MLLSDADLRKELEAGRLVLDPWDPAMLQPSSVDVRLDRFFRVFQNSRYTHIDPRQQQDELTTQVEPEGDEPFVLHPGEFVLGSTYEAVALPDDLAGRLEGKSLPGTPCDVGGWRTMGALRVGEHVFGIDGTTDPRRRRHRDHARPAVLRGVLLRRSDDHRRRRAPVADDDRGRPHGAESRPRSLRRPEIAGSLRAGSTWNHHIDLARPVQYPEQTCRRPYSPLGWAVWGF